MRNNKTKPTSESAATTSIQVELGDRHTLAANGAPPAATITVNGNLRSRTELIAQAIKDRIQPELDDSQQTELAELLDLLPDLAQPEHSHLIPLAEIAAAALISEKPNLTLAKTVREN